MTESSEKKDSYLQDLKVVKELMCKAGRHIILSPLQGLARGVLCIIGCLITYFGGQAGLFTGPVKVWMVWVGIVILDLGVETVLYIREARREDMPYLSSLARQLLLALLPLGLSGGVISFLFAEQGHPLLAAATWLMLLGSAYITVGLFSNPLIWHMGLVLIVAGLGVVFFPNFALLIMLILFGGGHIVWAIFLRMNSGS